MRRQDHAQQPLLRRLIRQLPAPSATDHRRIRVINVELFEPHGPLADVGADLARIYVTAHGLPIGCIELPYEDGIILESTLWEAVGNELAAECQEHLRSDGLSAIAGSSREHAPVCLADLEPPSSPPLVSVVIATRDRAAQLGTALASLQRLAYPKFEIVVVDNAPSDDATEVLVGRLCVDDPRIRYLREGQPGASRARNIGVTAAHGEIVAFTDDDVEVDPLWLNAIVAGFRDNPDAEVVGGLTLPGHLDTAAQHAFELYGGMGRGFRRRRYDLDQNRGDNLLYPYTAGVFGASNNAAFRRSSFLRRGGFDLALGPATPAYSAEDLDAFLAVILSGSVIVYEPRAVVYHEHRAEFADLYWQVFTYSAGSSALLTKWALQNGAVAGELMRRLPGLLPAALLRAHRSGAEAGVGAYPRQLRWLERAGYLYGPIAYFRSRAWARRQAAAQSGSRARQDQTGSLAAA